MKHLFFLLSMLITFGLGQDYSLQFDGDDDYVDLDNLTPMLTQSLTGTVQIMFKIDLESSSNNQPLFTINQHLDNPVVVRIGNQSCNDGTLNSSISFSDDDCGQSNPTVNAYWGDNPLYFYDNNWHILTLSVGDTFHQLFIDGEPINLVYTIGNQNTGNFLWRDNTNYFRLGQRWIDSSPDYPDDVQFFDGILDNLVLSANFLYPYEIESSINSGFNGENDIIAYYKFNTGVGTTLYDHSGNGNHGIINGATWVENIYGCTDELACNHNPDADWDDNSCDYTCHDNGDYSLSFDGVDVNLQLPFIDNIKAITFWININSINDGEHLIDCRDEEGTYQRVIWYGSPGNPDDDIQGFSTFNINNNTQNDFMGEFNTFPTNQRVFVYLESDESFGDDITLMSHRHLFYGGYENSTLNGIVDELAIWSSSLNHQELEPIINSENINDASGLIAHYKFNAGTGDTLYDHSGNGNHGTINGATWVCNDMDLCGVCGGDTCTTISDIDGNIYGTVQIGNQSWMRQNLKVTQYNEGGEIGPLFTEGQYWYGEDDGLDNETYGNLYNWYVVDNEEGICPDGWHVPSDEEFTILRNNLGGTSEAGGKLKAVGLEYWNEPNTGATNESGFTALPSGYWHLDNYYTDKGVNTTFLSSTDMGTLNWNSSLSYGDSNFNRVNDNKRKGFSIRCLETIVGCTDTESSNYDETANVDDGSCECEVTTLSGTYYYYHNTSTDSNDCNNISNFEYAIDNPVLNWTFYEDGNIDDEQSSPLSYIRCNNQVQISESQNTELLILDNGWMVGCANSSIPIVLILTGCTDPLADNYNPGATEDDGSCTGSPVNALDFTYAGELDGHYYYLSNYITDWNNANSISESSNGYLVTITNEEENNFVSIISNYINTWIGLTDENEEGVWDWVTDETFSYSNWFGDEPNNGDGNEDYVHTNYSGNGDWNDDTGISNFLFVLELERGCTDVLACNYQSYVFEDNGSCEYPEENYDCDGSCIEEDACGVCGGDNSSCTVTDIDENIYETVQIGNQNWMKKNLKVTHYNDGSEIQTGYSQQEWSSLFTGAYSVYPADASITCGDNCADVYGNLYNWHAVGDDRGICPEGWHVPEDEEYTALTDYLGGADVAGGKMKEAGTAHWNSPNTGATNESGFAALPAGYRNNGPNLMYQFIETVGFYWSATNNSSDQSWIIDLSHDNSEVSSSSAVNSHGFSIRCLENVEGCTDSLAINDTYNPLANTNDGSCEYPDNGDYSLSFDGDDDYVLTPDLHVMYEYTLEAKIFLSTQTSGTDFHNILSNGISNADVQFGADNNNPDGFIPRLNGRITSDTTLNRNQWYHLALVKDANNYLVYVNGSLVKEDDIAYNYADIYSVIGAWRYNGNLGVREVWEGMLDEIRIWNYARTQSDIINNMDIVELSEYDALLAYWKFNSGSEGILYDHSGNGNHGTIHGATWYVEGCTNPLADNYNPDATVDDGSCICSICDDYSLSFDGVDDYVSLPEEMLSSSDARTIMILVNPKSDGMIYSSFYNSTGEYRIEPHQFALKGNDSQWYYAAIPNEQVDYDVPVLITGIWDKQNIYFYHNDSLLATTELEGDLITGTFSGETMLANSGAHFNGPFEGDFSFCAVWKRALTHDEVTNIFDNTSNIVDYFDNIVAYWDFNEGSGNILNDLSGNENHGTIHGNPVWQENSYGCSTESDACNYEEGGNFTNQICLYDDCEGVCGGDAWADNCGVCYGDNSTCYIQSTEIAVYYFSSISLNDTSLTPGDLILARNEESGMVVGSGTYGNAGGDITEVMIYGEMGEDYLINTDGLMSQGEIPQFYVDGHKANYVAADGTILQNIPPFQSINVYIDLTLDLQTDCNGDMGGSAVTTGICGDCWGGNTGNTQDYMDTDVDDYGNPAPDGVCNEGAANGDADNCPDTSNTDQLDYDVDYEGDACDLDDDNDGVADEDDCEPFNNEVCCDLSDSDTCDDCSSGIYDPSNDGDDNDSDGLCDAGDPDDDNDNVADGDDSHPFDNTQCLDDDDDTCDDCSSGIYDPSNDGDDNDSDGLCDAGDPDDDNDNVVDEDDCAAFDNEVCCDLGDSDTCDDCSSGIYDPSNDGDDNDSDGWCNEGDQWPDCSNEIIDENPKDECGNCHGDGFADDCIGNNNCNDMDCAGLCGQENQQDDCGVCDDNYNNNCYDLEITLDGDINLISFPALPGNGDYSVENIFGELCDSQSSVIFDFSIAVIGASTACYCNDGLFYGSMREVFQDEGYWVILNTSPDTLIIYEAVPVSYDADGEVIYNMHLGLNLISYPFQTSQSLDDALGDYSSFVYGLLGEGMAALNTDNGWVGSLTAFEGDKGYWLSANNDFTFTFNGAENGLARAAYQPAVRPVPEAHRFMQSSRQAFYFIESATIYGKALDIDDIIIAYNGDVVVGARYWNGEYTDVPAMGMDDYSNIEGYCKSGDRISFKVWDASVNELIDMETDIETAWYDLSMSVINITEVLPDDFRLDSAYPNPFNPVTTLRFALPIESEVTLSIYNLQGREVISLINGNMPAGYHSAKWNADHHSSGMYFVKMIAGEYVNTQKLMLVK